MILLLKGLAVWIISSIVARMLLGAGLAITFHTWVTQYVYDALNWMSGSLAGIPGAEILWMAGVGEGLSIVAGALVAYATIVAAKMVLVRGQ